MPCSIDSVPLQDTFVLEGDGTESVENTARQRTLLSHTPRFFHECLSVIQLECFPISNVLVVNSLYYSVSFPHMGADIVVCENSKQLRTFQRCYKMSFHETCFNNTSVNQCFVTLHHIHTYKFSSCPAKTSPLLPRISVKLHNGLLTNPFCW